METFPPSATASAIPLPSTRRESRLLSQILLSMRRGLPTQSFMIKLRTTLGKFGEFRDLIAYFWIAWVRRNHFVNTNFSKLSKEIADPRYDGKCKH